MGDLRRATDLRGVRPLLDLHRGLAKASKANSPGPACGKAELGLRGASEDAVACAGRFRPWNGMESCERACGRAELGRLAAPDALREHRAGNMLPRTSHAFSAWISRRFTEKTLKRHGSSTLIRFNSYLVASHAKLNPAWPSYAACAMPSDLRHSGARPRTCLALEIFLKACRGPRPALQRWAGGAAASGGVSPAPATHGFVWICRGSHGFQPVSLMLK